MLHLIDFDYSGNNDSCCSLLFIRCLLLSALKFHPFSTFRMLAAA
jgi:hypothetical protein